VPAGAGPASPELRARASWAPNGQLIVSVTALASLQAADSLQQTAGPKESRARKRLLETNTNCHRPLAPKRSPSWMLARSNTFVWPRSAAAQTNGAHGSHPNSRPPSQ